MSIDSLCINLLKQIKILDEFCSSERLKLQRLQSSSNVTKICLVFLKYVFGATVNSKDPGQLSFLVIKASSDLS